MTTRGLTLFCCGVIAVAAGAPALAQKDAPSTLVPRGTVVALMFAQRLQSQNAQKGQVVKLRAWSDVRVNGKVVVRQDAPAQGIVTNVKRPRSFGRKASIRIRLQWVQDVKGGHVPLQAYSTGRRFDPKGPGASAGGLLLLGPVGLIGGIFVKGGHITIKQGTRIRAKVLAPGERPDYGEPPVDANKDPGANPTRKSGSKAD